MRVLLFVVALAAGCTGAEPTAPEPVVPLVDRLAQVRGQISELHATVYGMRNPPEQARVAHELSEQKRPVVHYDSTLDQLESDVLARHAPDMELERKADDLREQAHRSRVRLALLEDSTGPCPRAH